MLKFIKNQSPVPWICVGDFNEIVSMTEKWGGAGKRDSQMEQFRNTLEDDLSDLGLVGSKFTCSIAREDGSFMKERLDRVLANNEWRMFFQEVEVQVLAARSSDHKPLLVNFARHKEERYYSKNGLKFEAKWMLEEEYQEVVRDAWQSSKWGGTT